MHKRLITGLFLTLIVMKVNAASFGTYRIHLDNKIPHEKFVVKNNSIFPEKCKISFTYRQYKENGELVKLTTDEQAKRSRAALDRVRYSPRQFTIQPKSSQFVSFKYRRQINDKPAEYRTYVNFACIAIKDQEEQAGINFKPAIVHAIPLVIRTASLRRMPLNLSFLNAKQQGKSVSFRVLHAGVRSFVGDIHLLTENGSKLLTLRQNFALYPDMIYKDLSLNLAEHYDKKLKVVFQENNQYGSSDLFELPLPGVK
jgi:hypothetical protein